MDAFTGMLSRMAYITITVGRIQGVDKGVAHDEQGAYTNHMAIYT